MGLSYFDSASGQSVLLARVRAAPGQLVSSNQILYRDAFEGLKADVRYSYRRWGLEQDVLLRERPPGPQRWGLNPHTTRLQVLTEFVESPPPRLQTRAVAGGGGVESDLEVDFGPMRIGCGKAFEWGLETPGAAGSTPVFKAWVEVRGRRFLIEEVRYTAVEGVLERLPAGLSAETAARPLGRGVNAAVALADALPLPQPHRERAPVQVAWGAVAEGPALVLDYQLLVGATNFTFRSDTTYYCSGPVHLFGQTVLEGGAVVKFATNATASVVVHDQFECRTGPYRRAIFTAADDDTVGETISGSRGTPQGYYGGVGLDLSALPYQTLSHLRWSHLRSALAGYGLTLRQVQVIRCQNGFGIVGGADMFAPRLENVLIHQVQTFVPTENYAGDTVVGLHVTAHDCEQFVADTTSAVSLTNCLFVNVGGWQSAIMYTNASVFLDSAAGVFEVVAAGAHYLATNSPYRNAGTSNLAPGLLAHLRTQTTWPPQRLSGVRTNDLTLAPQAARDTDTPDLGYHYEPLDYLLEGLILTNRTLTVEPGTVLAAHTNNLGLWLAEGGRIQAEGQPLQPIWWVRGQSVQEQPAPLDPGTILINTYHSGSNLPEGWFRFCRFSAPANGGYHLYHDTDWAFANLEVRDCEFWGGQNSFKGARTGAASRLSLRNSLFWRSGVGAMALSGISASAEFGASNNLVVGVAVLWRQPSGASWQAHDNVFEQCSFSAFGSQLNNSHNAYINCSGQFANSQGGDLVLSTFAWTNGPLGEFYQAGESLLNQGSRSAAEAGLYHHTVLINQTRAGELGNGQVSIGYHYVALDAAGQPLDSDADGTADYRDEDADGDGLPDRWELEHFGNLNQGPNDDYDNDGLSNLDEYLARTDPNSIAFNICFDASHVNGNATTGRVMVFKGVPEKMAVLVNSTNFAGASWVSFSSNFVVGLGSSDGEYEVWVGVKGRAEDSKPMMWFGSRLMRDTISPTIIITNPQQRVVFQPIVQLQGYALEPVAAIRYDLTNADGSTTNLEGYVVKQFIDPSTLLASTNWFECPDVSLAPGDNIITLYVVDAAGNIATNTYVFTFLLPTNPPTISLWWPQPGAKLSGTNFTVRGMLNDATAEVTAEVRGAEGATSATGVVERDGKFWIEHLPLSPGTNFVTITAVDIATNVAQTNFTVVRSEEVELSLDPIDPGMLNRPYISVTGSINATGYKVWVNGVAATNQNGRWAAEFVPLPEGGAALIQVRAIPLSDNDGNGIGGSGGRVATYQNPGNPDSAQSTSTEENPDKPCEVISIRYHKDLLDRVDTLALPPWSDGHEVRTETWRWDRDEPGRAFGDWCFGSDEVYYYEWWEKTWDQTGEGWAFGEPTRRRACGERQYGEGIPYTAPRYWDGEKCAVEAWRLEADSRGAWGIRFRSRQALTRYELRTGGKAPAGRRNLFVLEGWALGVGNPFWPEVDYAEPRFYEIRPEQVVLGSLGALGNDWRLYKVLPDGARYDVTPTVTGPSYYIYHDPAATKHKVAIAANGVTLDPEKVMFTNCVGQKVTFALEIQPQVVISDLVGAWRLPEKFVNEPYQFSDTCTSYRVNNRLLLNTNRTTCWYVNGSGGTVGIGASLRFTNGQYATVAALGRFKVVKPMIIERGPSGRQGIQASFNTNDPVKAECILICYVRVLPPEPFSGKLDYVQLVKRATLFGNPLRIVGICRDDKDLTNGEFWLDNTCPYRNDPIDMDVFWSEDPKRFYHTDLPGYENFCEYIVVNDEFKVYLRFAPPGGIPITIQRIDWGWSCNATNVAGTWTWQLSTNPPTWHEDDAFPEWRRVYHNSPD